MYTVVTENQGKKLCPILTGGKREDSKAQFGKLEREMILSAVKKLTDTSVLHPEKRSDSHLLNSITQRKRVIKGRKHLKVDEKML